MANNNSGTMVSNIVNEGGKEFTIEMNQMLDELEPLPSREPFIYRVPMDVRKVNEDAYTPHIVSIGPFHHNNEKLKSMEQLKKWYMKKLVRRNGNSSLNDCTNFVMEKEVEIRACYSERIEMDSKEFRKMILVDSCFIIQFLIFVNTDYEQEIHHMTMNRLVLDLMLVENQVPFFVLKELCCLATYDAFSICELALDFLKKATNTHLFEGFEHINMSELRIDSAKHLTDMVLILHHPPPSREQPTTQNENFRTLHSATELTEAGVTFKEETQPATQNENFPTLHSATELTEAGVTFKEETNKGLFNVTFEKGMLKIPSVLLTNHTVIQIRNIMALELLLYEDQTFVTDYFFLMDWLVNTTKDVKLLVDKKIIINHLGDYEAATNFINNLCINVLLSKEFYFLKVCKDLNKYYEFLYHKLKATLKHDYFRTPCLAASTIGVITLLVLTIIQTVCTVMSTVNGK